MGPPPQELVERFLTQQITRRTINSLFAAGSVGLIIDQHVSELQDLPVATECIIKRAREGPSRYKEVEIYRDGIEYDEWLKQELIASGTTSDPMSIQQLPLSEGELFKGTISLDKPQYLIVQARGTKTPDRRIQVLGISLNDGINSEGEDYYHVIPDVPENKKATTTLYDRKPGDYLLSIKTTDFSYEIQPEDLDVQVMSFKTDNPIFQTVIRRIPRVHLRQDNLNRITRNMPVSNPWRIGKTQDGLLYHVEHGELLLGQEEGRDLCISGSAEDNEVFSFDLLTQISGLLVEQAGQEGVHHEMREYPLPYTPYEVTENAPIVDLVILTKNNIPSRNPDYFTHKMVAPFDNFRPMTESAHAERQTIFIANAWQERAEKGELSKQKEKARKFIKERLAGDNIIHIQ